MGVSSYSVCSAFKLVQSGFCLLYTRHSRWRGSAAGGGGGGASPASAFEPFPYIPKSTHTAAQVAYSLCVNCVDRAEIELASRGRHAPNIHFFCKKSQHVFHSSFLLSELTTTVHLGNQDTTKGTALPPIYQVHRHLPQVMLTTA